MSSMVLPSLTPPSLTPLSLTPPSTFGSLRLGRAAQSVVARLIRFWDSRNINKNNEFMGITIFLLDELGTSTPSSPMSRYFELQRSVVMRWLMQFSGFRESLLADDLFLAKLAMECGVGVFTKTAAEYERRRENFFNELQVVFANVVIILLCLCVHVRSQEWSETYYSIKSFEIVRGVPVTSRRLDSHGMVEENRGEAALPSARPGSEHGISVKKTCIE
ncbi:hypothetical protein HID58_061558 [Brassica napus]|uniref:Uncharacterized protein n=1 Tax=Brassica napus TaxID=3708 RepID=A0ABQ7ZYX7_BRANA|nr:hypothetical protein HID58_061558 [Brassica napus]